MKDSSSKGALAGIKVVDLARVLGGPFCTQLLADHGAEVIKVEPPTGDETREWGPPFKDGLSAYYSGINRNKRSLGLDVSTPAGREVVLKLLADADVLVENFKPGTLEKWGLGYEEVLAERFPRLIHARLTGFGADGPMGGFPGYDAMVQAWAGMMSVNGLPESGPTRVGMPLVDIGTGLNLACGILMAIVERGRSGKGQFLEVTLFDAAITFQHPHAANYLMSGAVPKLSGNRHGTVAPYEVIPALGRHVLIGAGNDRQFRMLCKQLGRPDVADDPRFKTNRDRVANVMALSEILRELVSNQDGEELANRLMQAGVPAGALLTVPDVLEHPHTRHREMVVEKDGYRGTGTPIKLSRTPARLRNKPPQFGGNNREILREAGYSDGEIETLEKDGVVMNERRKM